MKSKFLSSFSVEDRTGENGNDIPSVYLTENLGFFSSVAELNIWVPRMYHCDSASIPRALWGIYPSWGRWNRAAVVHDWLYSVQVTTRGEADSVFLDALEVCGVPLIRRKLFYRSVRMFGRCRWDGVTPERIQINREHAHAHGGGVFPCFRKS